MSYLEKVKILFSSMWDFLGPFLRLFLSKMGPVLAASAMAAVKTVAGTMQGSSGAAKREAAYDIIVWDLKQQAITVGVDVTTSAINAAIEAAVQKMK